MDGLKNNGWLDAHITGEVLAFAIRRERERERERIIRDTNNIGAIRRVLFFLSAQLCVRRFPMVRR